MTTVPEPSGSAALGDEDDDDTEWEYEYHETETENFYLTLELPALPRSRKKKPASASIGVEATIPAEATTNNVVHPTTRHSGSPQPGSRVELKPEDRIQILDLHTKNPIISYENRFYSCYWASTVGTDLFLTSTDDPNPCAPLQSHPGFNILGTSGLKIIGQPVQVVPRDSFRAGKAAAELKRTPTVSIEKSATIQQESEGRTGDAVRIPIGIEAGRLKNNQARFLERLMAIKKKKGEADEVTIHSQKVNEPSGWRSSHNENDFGEHSENTAEESEDNSSEEGQDNGQAQPQTENPRRPRYRGTRRPGGKRRPRAAGGLFRDYRPRADDSEGADIRGAPDRTPRTWDELRREVHDGNE